MARLDRHTRKGARCLLLEKADAAADIAEPYRMTQLGSGVCIAAVEMMSICVGRGLDPSSKPPLARISHTI